MWGRGGASAMVGSNGTSSMVFVEVSKTQFVNFMNFCHN